MSKLQFLNVLQKEYFICKMRSNILEEKGGYFRLLMLRKKQKIQSLSSELGVDDIFSSKLEFNTFQNLVQNRVVWQKVLEPAELKKYYSKGKFTVSGKPCSILKYNQDKKLVTVNCGELVTVVECSKVKRIF